jgi:small-conductance mechanosensitive channel
MKTDLFFEIVSTVISITGGIVLFQVIFYFLKRWARKKKRIIPTLLNRYVYVPGLCLMIAVTLWITLLLFKDQLSIKYYLVTRHALMIGIIGAAGFLCIRAITVFRELALYKYTVQETQRDYSYRKAKTKFQLIQKILNAIIGFGTVAIILMTFESIRHIGGTLLASAGVLGLIIGFAAQKSLGTLFAGIQIAISQPIRIDDVVVVENEFGTIGEITLTYVVIFTWDGRRLVVPINYFLEKSFENWTRVSPEVIGKVKIYADYTLPVEEVRQEFFKLIGHTELWDRRKSGFAVTGSNEKTIELRATMSAKDSGDAWDLECLVREKLITFIQKKYPDALPKSRLNIISDKSEGGKNM